MQTATARWSRVPTELCEQKLQLKQRERILEESGDSPKRARQEGPQGNAKDLPVPGGLEHSGDSPPKERRNTVNRWVLSRKKKRSIMIK